MKINRNMSAVMTNKQLRRTENRLQASMERLSSGFKINSAGDNPAGMAISNKMRAQIDALKQAGTNASDGISVIQIADGALNEVSNMLQRIRELSVQAANDTNGYEDKKAMQDEIAQLRKEVDRISTDTEFNTKKLLDGSSNIRIYSEGATRVNISDQVPAGKYNMTIDQMGTQAVSTINVPTPLPESGSIAINGVGVEFKPGMTQEDCMQAIQQAAIEAGTKVEINGSQMTFTSTLYGAEAGINISVPTELAGMLGDAYEEIDGQCVSKKNGTDASVTLTTVGTDEVGLSQNATWTSEGNRIFIKDNNGFSMDFLLDADYEETDLEIEVTEIGQMTIQIGSNEFQTMDVRIPSVSSDMMYLDTVDVTVVGGADRAISTLDEAIAYLSSVRSTLGAYQNRMEYANNSLAETHEDMTAAYSRILDTDMAEEMTEYSQINILDQATISVLSQANDIPQQVLSLLS